MNFTMRCSTRILKTELYSPGGESACSAPACRQAGVAPAQGFIKLVSSHALNFSL